MALTVLLPAWAADPPAPPRVEAHSSDLVAVGVVHDDKMSIHVSRIADNAPLREAVISVVLRGTEHSTTAETDGGYSLQTPDLRLPGAAAVEFRISQGSSRASKAPWMLPGQRAPRTTGTPIVSSGGGC
jgi:hypothetical protein